MWKRLPLRFRLFLPTIGLIVTSLLLRIPNLATAHPIMVGQKHVGDVLFVPDLTPDLSEKWMGFLAIVLSGSALLVLAAVSAYLTTTMALRPLEQLGAGLARMQQGDYDSTIPLLGPPEVRQSCEQANQLARKLKRLAQDNRNMLRQFVSLQDDEREEIAKELHDELGPLLFAIRAHAIALSDSSADLEAPSSQLVQAAEAVQQASRRILEGLSPLHLEELGLEKSIQTLLQNAHSALPSVATSAEIDPRLDSLDHLISQTIYRVIQEAITNVVKHARATTLNVVAAMRDHAVTIEVSDDGVGFPDNVSLGRGLTGMSDRSRALDGKLDLLRENGRTVVRCWLPLPGARFD
jgi:two-component system sensor histidine kinase UhpB